ncbi:MAG: GNAT family N-acetyltransferase, partial [Spirochaetaceae bacterium]|nr:GNAT family N-acetyltransferase [Spirochaetaceae bacterium]
MAQINHTRFGYIVIDEQDDPAEVIDEIINNGCLHQYCYAKSFNTEFLIRLLKAGFLLMSTDDYDGSIILEPCHHLTVSVLFFDHIHIPKQIKRLLGRYELRYDVEFDVIVDKCIQKHGGGWLTGPLIEAFKEIKKAGDDNLTFTSFGLYRDGRLVAGEFGSKTGRIYTSYSGYYDESCAGTVQMILTARYLLDQGYALWNYGMPLPYKAYLGGRIVN